MHACFHEGGTSASGAIGGPPGPPWCRRPSIMGVRPVEVWSGRVATGAICASIACPRVRQRVRVAGREARHGTSDAERPRRRATLGSPGLIVLA